MEKAAEHMPKGHHYIIAGITYSCYLGDGPHLFTNLIISTAMAKDIVVTKVENKNGTPLVN